jgi:hypothetical protein
MSGQRTGDGDILVVVGSNKMIEGLMGKGGD